MAKNEIASLLIPTQSRSLLLPNTTVAEIVTYVEPESSTKSEDLNWYLGDITWRETRVPLVSVELLNGYESFEAPDATARIAVINRVSDQSGPEFYAILVQGIPRLVRVIEEEIGIEKTDTGAVDAMIVNVNGERAVIPDLDQLEMRVADL